MNRNVNSIIAGAGGIAEAVGLTLAERSKVSPALFTGNRTLSKTPGGCAPDRKGDDQSNGGRSL